MFVNHPTRCGDNEFSSPCENQPHRSLDPKKNYGCVVADKEKR